MLESKFQTKVIKALKLRLPGCVVIKNDPGYIQGFPDLTILYHGFWAVLEVKASMDACTQANQEYYIEMLDEMSFAAFICPENEVEVLDAIQRTFETHRAACVPKS